MNKLSVITLIITLVMTIIGSFAVAQNKGIKFQARVKYTSTSELLNQSGLTVNLRLLSPNNCVLWEENHTPVDVSGGYLNLIIGNGVTGGAHPAGTTMKAVFDNSTSRTGLTCVDASNNVNGALTTYTPVSGDIRKVRVSFTVGTENILADFSLRTNGYAINSETLEGKSATDFIQIGAAGWPYTCPTGQFVTSVSATGVLTCSVGGGGGGAVSSVAGRTGAITLTTSDVSGLGSAALLGVGTTTGTVAAGDDSRFTKINGVAVSATAPTANQVLQYNGTQYVPVALPSAPVTTVAGRTGAVTLTTSDIFGLGGSSILNVGTTAGTVAAGDDSRFTKINGVAVSATAPTANQILQYNGTQYVPVALPSAPVTTVAGRTGAITLAAADISGLGAAASMAVGTTAGTVAAGNDSRITGALQTGATATGDLSGTLPNPTVAKIQGIAVSATAPVTGQVLQYNGTQYAPVALPTAPVTTVAGRTGAITLAAADISGLGAAASMAVGTTAGTVAAGNDSRITGALQTGATVTGDLSGTLPNPTVAKIQGIAVSVTAPVTGQVLQYNGTQYAPVALPSAPVTTVAGRTGAITLAAADISGLGAAASMAVGTTAGTVAAGNDSRITGALQLSAHNAYVASANCTTSQTMYWNSVSSTFACQNIVFPSAPVTTVAGRTGAITLAAADISGLGAAASMAVGTTAGTLAAGDDSRFTKINGVAVSATAPTANQILQYNGTQYVPVALPSAPVTTVAGRTGAITLAAADISGLGTASTYNAPVTGNASTAQLVKGDDSRLTDSRAPAGAASGDLAGTYPSPTLSTTGVTAGTYGMVTVDAKGRVTAGAQMTAANINTALTYTAANQLYSFSGNGTDVYRPTGNVGIGNSAPTVALDVTGAIRAGASTAVTTCGSGSAAGEGSQRYNYTTHQMEYCNGSTWVTSVTPNDAVTAGATCTASNIGQVSYTQSNGAVKVCTGTSWRTLGTAIEDKIEGALTTNQAAYIAASAGDYVVITAAEYTALQTAVTGSVIAGQKDAVTLYSSTYDFGGPSAASVSAATTASNSAVTASVPANNWIYAFAVKIGAANATANRTYRLQIGPALSTTSNFKTVGNLAGSDLLSNTAGEIKYFVIKGGAKAVVASDIAVYGGSFSYGNITNHSSYYTTTSVSPTMETMVTNWGTIAPYIQALSTPTKQW